MINKVENLDVEKLRTVPTDVYKLNNVVSNGVAKRLFMLNWSLRAMLLILRYQVLEEYQYQLLSLVYFKQAGSCEED